MEDAVRQCFSADGSGPKDVRKEAQADHASSNGGLVPFENELWVVMQLRSTELKDLVCSADELWGPNSPPCRKTNAFYQTPRAQVPALLP